MERRTRNTLIIVITIIIIIIIIIIKILHVVVLRSKLQIKVALFTQSWYTDTGATNPTIDTVMPDDGQDSKQNSNF